MTEKTGRGNYIKYLSAFMEQVFERGHMVTVAFTLVYVDVVLLTPYV